ncbi:MAG TPA: cytochrome c biogenesis protein CcdA [Candidatus Colwellbacteria bacterium]|nr:cytochrome c biogenesis protein CcdA [Candidatus Colwellbacteria bacterium]
MSKKIWLWIGIAVLLVLGAMAAKTKISGFSPSEAVNCSPAELLSIICLAAILDSMNPCAFSVLLLTMGFLFSLESVERKKIMRIGVIFIAAIFATYLLIGLGLLKAFQIFGVPRFISRFGAVALIAFGLIEIIGEVFPSFPVKLKIPEKAKPAIAKLIEKGSEWAALLLGFLVGLTEFPCTGGPYLVMLSLLHDKATFVAGFKYLLVYNLIFVIPLVVILFMASDKGLIQKIDGWQI